MSLERVAIYGETSMISIRPGSQLYTLKPSLLSNKLGFCRSIMSIISYYDHMQDKHIPTHGPGKWHDPDMVSIPLSLISSSSLISSIQLVIGNAGITPDMARAQMTIWCIWSAPLIMSNDLR